MLAGGYSWRLYFYVVIAFASALLIAAFFVVEETTYKRPDPKTSSPPPTITDEKLMQPGHEETVAPAAMPKRKSFISTLKPWSAIDRDEKFFMTMLRSFTYFPVPAVLWVITSFGMNQVQVSGRQDPY
jgi:MFS family permease